MEGTKARLKPVVCVGEVARLWHYRLDPIVHREAEGWRFFDLEKFFVSTYMLMRLVICTLYWALMPATVVGKNMVAQARVTNKPLKNRATELQP